VPDDSRNPTIALIAISALIVIGAPVAHSMGGVTLTLLVLGAVIIAAGIVASAPSFRPASSAQARVQRYTVAVLFTVSVALFASESIWLPLVNHLLGAMDLAAIQKMPFWQGLLVLVVLGAVLWALHLIWARSPGLHGISVESPDPSDSHREASDQADRTPADESPRNAALVPNSRAFEPATAALDKANSASAPQSTSRRPPQGTTRHSAMRIYLCHARANKRDVRGLRSVLRTDGFASWIAADDILPGQDRDLEVSKAVRLSKVVIVCLSRVAFTEIGVIHDDISHVLDIAQHQPQGSIYIIPLLLEPCKMQRRLARLQCVNWYEGSVSFRLRKALLHCAEELGIDQLPASLNNT
jgi:hypothetical protein